MYIAMAIGMLIVLGFYIYDRETIRIEWPAVASFLAFMTLITFLRLSIFEYSHVPPAIANIPKFLFSLVWWEDGYFVLPIYIVLRYFKPLPAFFVVAAISLQFGFGHMYQGWIAVALTSLYPYFIAHNYGIKYGFGTVMVCHVLYDYITYYTVTVAPYF